MGCKITKGLMKHIPSVKDCMKNNNGVCPSENEKSIMRKAGAFFLGSGIHRNGYKFRGSRGSSCVIKIPVMESTKPANISEIEGWQKVKILPKNARKYLLEVTDFEKTGDWVTQPEVITLKKLGYGSDIVRDFEEELQEKGFCDLGTMDIHRNNVGGYKKDVRKKNNISLMKVLDYGFGVCFRGKWLSSRGKIIDKQSGKIIRILEKKGKSTSSSSSHRRILREKDFGILPEEEYSVRQGMRFAGL